MTDIIEKLTQTITDRQQTPKEGSYTTSLFEAGIDAIVQKVGEEAIEVVIAAKGQGNERLISESADLLYHLLVLLASQGLTIEDVKAELARRHQ